MTTAVQSPYSRAQISAWLQGLLTIAWADGHFDEEEKVLIADLMKHELAPKIDVDAFEPISPKDLAIAFGKGSDLADNFLRTAVMVAIADGMYSEPEDRILHQFCVALGLDETVLNSLRQTLQTPAGDLPKAPASVSDFDAPHYSKVLQPVQEWLDALEVHDPRVARFLCKMIPPQCPFERDVKLFGKKVVHIPAMCKLNPLYEQLVGLRFRSLSYLADDCGEDITPYI
jgi:tellurite resistance protein